MEHPKKFQYLIPSCFTNCSLEVYLTSTLNKCVARENLGLSPASPYSGFVDGEVAGIARWWISCCKNPTYAAGAGTGCNTGT